jgi:signal transduction histidine kinase
MSVPSYVMILGVLALELWVLRRVRAAGTERQAAFMVSASVFALAANWAYVSGLSQGLNATLPVLAVSGVILTIGMVREGLFGVIPLALPVIVSRDPDGLVVVRPHGGLLYANPRAREFLAPVPLTPELPLLAALIPRLREADGAEIARSESDWEERWWHTVLQPGGALYRFGDGEERWLRISGQPVHGSRNRLLAHCLRLHDATYEQGAEIEVRRARRLESVAELSLGVAHDFHNLLMVMKGNAELLAEDLPDDPKLQRMLYRILRSGEQARELADQLRLYAGDAEVTRVHLDLSELVRDTFELLDPNLLSSRTGESFDLKLDLSSDPVTIEADATQLRQVILNLLVNARDALAQEGGEIRVVTGSAWVAPDRAQRLVVGKDERAGEYGFLRVSDTGRGMDAATQERIFEPFFSTKGKHRGIGLSTVFGIVRSHDALLELESSVGHGTLFSVYFPIVGPIAGPVAAPGNDARVG